MISRNARPEKFFAASKFDSLTAIPVISVLEGDLALAVYPGFASIEDCETIMRQFLAEPQTRKRTGDATGYYLGAFHWGKDLGQYTYDCQRVSASIAGVLDSARNNPWKTFVSTLEAHLRKDHVILRPAQISGIDVATPIVRSWTGQGAYSLVPHEDEAQCSDPNQAGFEIQKVPAYNVCSVNLCIGNDGGGDLVMWNYEPSTADRESYGTSVTGGPYPAEILQNYSRIQIRVGQGDLYIFNGALVHAVSPTIGNRATISSLMGFADDENVILWT